MKTPGAAVPGRIASNEHWRFGVSILPENMADARVTSFGRGLEKGFGRRWGEIDRFGATD